MHGPQRGYKGDDQHYHNHNIIFPIKPRCICILSNARKPICKYKSTKRLWFFWQAGDFKGVISSPLSMQLVIEAFRQTPSRPGYS